MLVEQGEIRRPSNAIAHAGRTLHVNAAYDQGVEPHIRDWFNDNYSIQFGNYPIGDELGPNESIACG